MGSKAFPLRARPRVEALEDRRLLSTITDLGIFEGGRISYAYSVNNSGQVAGYADETRGEYKAFFYSDGVLNNLGSIQNGKYSDAYGINDAGQIVGYSNIGSDGPLHGFFYDNGTMMDMGTLGGPTSDAWAINNAGQVAGYADTVTGFGIPHAFRWDLANGMQDLGTLGGPLSYGYGINQGGDVTGSAMTPSGLLHAFVWSNGVMTDLGTLPGGNYSQGWSLNSSGVVAGFGTVAGDTLYHAFAYSNGVMTDIGTLGGDHSIAYAVNSAGDVLGTSEIISGFPSAHAFIYTGGVMLDLNSLLPPASGWTLFDARWMNDNGQVVGVGRHNGNTDYHAYLLDLNGSPSIASQNAALQTGVSPAAPFAVGLAGTTPSQSGRNDPASLPVSPLLATPDTAVSTGIPTTANQPLLVLHQPAGDTAGATLEDLLGLALG